MVINFEKLFDLQMSDFTINDPDMFPHPGHGVLTCVTGKNLSAIEEKVLHYLPIWDVLNLGMTCRDVRAHVVRYLIRRRAKITKEILTILSMNAYPSFMKRERPVPLSRKRTFR